MSKNRLVPNRNYSDPQGKTKLKDTWRYRPTSWEGHWVRARPSTGTATMPALIRSGSFGTLGARTEADGMYVRLAAGAVTADVLAIEVCTSLQNLHDKRSRFAASTTSLLLLLNRPWMREEQQIQHTTRQRWNTFDGALPEEPGSDLLVPVFRLRLFLMVPCVKVSDWREKVALEAHEYLLPHRALDNQYDPRLVRMLSHAFDDRVWEP